MKSLLNIEEHPLEPFLPANAKLLMLGSFPPQKKRWSTAGLFAEARPPAASSWCVPNTFPPAATDVHILHTGDVFPNASPQNTSCIAPPSQMVAAGR